MTLKLRVYPQANRDVELILYWLASHSQLGAERWFDKYSDMLRILPERAEGCAHAPEASIFGREIRQYLFRTRKGHTYRSLFTIKDDVIHLFAVRGAGQDLIAADEFEFVDE